MKVLHVQKVSGVAGSERFLLNSLPRLAREGVEVGFLALVSPGSEADAAGYLKELRDLGVRTHQLTIGPIPTPRSLVRIAELVRREGHDTVHTHLIHANTYLSLVKLLLRPDLVLVSTHHGYDERVQASSTLGPVRAPRSLFFHLSRFGMAMADRTIAISRGLRDFFLANQMAPPRRLLTLPYALELPPCPEPDPGDGSPGRSIVVVGRLVEVKGHRFLLEAMPEITRRCPDTTLVVVGSGPLEAELRATADRLGVGDSVVFTGWSTTPERWVRGSDVVVVPSVSEGFGMVFLEAFNCRRPVVAFDVPAGNEIVVDGETGFLVPPFDATELGAAVVRLLDDETTRVEMGEAAYRRLTTEYSAAERTRRVLALYAAARDRPFGASNSNQRREAPT